MDLRLMAQELLDVNPWLLWMTVDMEAMIESLVGMMTTLMDMDLDLLWMTGDMDMMDSPAGKITMIDPLTDMMDSPAGMMITMIDPLTGKIEECSVTDPELLLEELEEIDSLYSMEFVAVLELDIKSY